MTGSAECPKVSHLAGFREFGRFRRNAQVPIDGHAHGRAPASSRFCRSCDLRRIGFDRARRKRTGDHEGVARSFGVDVRECSVCGLALAAVACDRTTEVQIGSSCGGRRSAPSANSSATTQCR